MLPPHITIELKMASIGILVDKPGHKPLMVKTEPGGGDVRWGWTRWRAMGTLYREGMQQASWC